MLLLVASVAGCESWCITLSELSLRLNTLSWQHLPTTSGAVMPVLSAFVLAQH